MNINYKLIVSDFDGTLIDDNQNILPEVKTAIDEYVAAGGIFAVCTGRMLSSILPQVRALGLKGLVIAYQGTVIADIETGKIIKSGGMSSADSAKICAGIEKLGYGINVYCDEKIYTDYPDDNVYLKKYEEIIGVKAVHINGNMSEYISKNNMFCQKILTIVSESERNELYMNLCKSYGKNFDVTCSAKVLVEVSPIDDNKGNALKFLAQYYNVPVEKTVAVGDNLNDLSMVKVAGVGCAVGNAEMQLKEAADFISVSNNEGALAQIIKKFGFA